MVVRLHLKRDHVAIADVNNAGIFLAGLHEHAGAILREKLQYILRILVRAVFAPHDTEYPKLRDVGRAAKYLFDVLVLARRNAVLGDNVRRYV